MEFIAKSPVSQKLLNTLRVSINLPVNILVCGEEGTGKRTLVRSFFKDTTVMSVDEVKESIESKKELYIYDLHRCSNLKALMQKLEGTRVIATANDYKETYEEFFSVILHIPPLRERPEDLEALKERYVQEAMREFELEEFEGSLNLDLSKNAISLKRSIFTAAVMQSIDEEGVMELLEQILAPRLEEGYKELLYLFEVPLLRAAKKKYGSNLAISKALRLNRATVTSKMNRYKALIK
jgi:DNA-binding NtrC family response regulator